MKCESTKQEKYLCIKFESLLTITNYVSRTGKKASPNLQSLAKVVNVMDLNEGCLMKSLIKSQLNYCTDVS